MAGFKGRRKLDTSVIGLKLPTGTLNTEKLKPASRPLAGSEDVCE